MATAVMSSTPSLTMSAEASPPNLNSRLSALKRLARLTLSEATEERFQDSFGTQLSELGGRSRWCLAGLALSIWQDDLQGRIDELIVENEGEIYKSCSIRDTSMASHCWMLGSDQHRAFPTVVLFCNTSDILKRAMRLVLRHRILKPKGFALKGSLACDLRLLTMSVGKRRSVRLVHIDGKSLGGSLRTLCGAEIFVQGSDRPATLGGVINVGGTYYGLTVAHVFFGKSTASEKTQTVEQDTQLYDSDWAEKSSSDDNSEAELDLPGNSSHKPTIEKQSGGSDGMAEAFSNGSISTRESRIADSVSPMACIECRHAVQKVRQVTLITCLSSNFRRSFHCPPAREAANTNATLMHFRS